MPGPCRKAKIVHLSEPPVLVESADVAAPEPSEDLRGVGGAARDRLRLSRRAIYDT